MAPFVVDFTKIPAERSPTDLENGQSFWDNLAKMNRELAIQIRTRDEASKQIRLLTDRIKKHQAHVMEYYMLGEQK